MPSGFSSGNMPVSATYFTFSPAMVTELVVKTGLCDASGMLPSEVLDSAVLLVSPDGEFVCVGSAAHAVKLAAAKKIRICFVIRDFPMRHIISRGNRRQMLF